MIEIYANEPKAVECFPLGRQTDVILRRYITHLPEADGEDVPTGWKCEERQFRYAGKLDEEAAQADFDRWWAYDPDSDVPPTLADRVAALEEAQLAIMDLALGGVADV